ncbi:hypothetical protein L3X38_006198 [Prunus dulcis]|uniref:Uncharacterized protein n=1 Tax=Prunus dulcis TaxID=3755 RepID=A0AAD4ZS83_PRUDU|nr:hypothetical protein L3X38_006198 [Prunus dulcis]
MIKRVHLDEGNAANILQLSVVRQMGLGPKINKFARSLMGFNEVRSIIIGTIDLNIHSPPVVCSQTFMVIEEISPAMESWADHRSARLKLSHPLHTRRSVTPSPGTKSCRSIVVKTADEAGICKEGSPEECWKLEEDIELVPIDLDLTDRNVWINSRLSLDDKMELTTFIQHNKDMFARSLYDMPDIDPQIICHQLHVNPAIKPVAQKRSPTQNG